MSKKPNTERLRKLADHLLHGELGHKVFNFATYNRHLTKEELLLSPCGTSGCAVGECPIVFPEDWCFRKDEDYENFYPVLKESKDSAVLTIRDSAEEFFNIGDNFEFDHLFLPECQSSCRPYYTETLSAKATKEQVAQNIIAFCDYYDNLKD